MNGDAMATERDGLAALFEQVATARETEPQVADDLRYALASEAIRAIAATLDQISDDALMRLATANTACGGAVGRAIVARLLAVGFELPPCNDAAMFLAPIMREAERTLHQSRQRLH